MLYVLCFIIGGLFFMFSYRLGVQDGLDLNKNKDLKTIDPITSISNSIKEVKSSKKKEEAENDFLAGLNNILAYDGKQQTVKDAQ